MAFTGDALVAGVAVALATGRGVEDAIKLGVSSGTANIFTKKPGELEQATVNNFFDKVKITKIRAK